MSSMSLRIKRNILQRALFVFGWGKVEDPTRHWGVDQSKLVDFVLHKLSKYQRLAVRHSRFHEQPYMFYRGKDMIWMCLLFTSRCGWVSGISNSWANRLIHRHLPGCFSHSRSKTSRSGQQYRLDTKCLVKSQATSYRSNPQNVVSKLFGYQKILSISIHRNSWCLWSLLFNSQFTQHDGCDFPCTREAAWSPKKYLSSGNYLSLSICLSIYLSIHLSIHTSR